MDLDFVFKWNKWQVKILPLTSLLHKLHILSEHHVHASKLPPVK